MLDHLPGDRLAEEEDRALIDLDDFVPIFLTEFEQRRSADDAGVVEQDVDAAEFLDRGIDNALHGGAFEQIGLDLADAASQRAHALSGFIGTGQANQSEVSARRGKTERRPLSEAAARSRYHRHFPVQFEFVEYHACQQSGFRSRG